MDCEKKYELITKNLQEVIGADQLKNIIKTRNLKLYWGIAPTGKIHIAYFLPLLKIRDFLEADCEVTIFLADVHALLDNLKSTLEVIEHRTKYYRIAITAMLKALGVTKSIKFINGSEYQKTPEYCMDLYRISTITNLRDSRKAGTEVVKQIEDPLMSSLMYPMMQALDEQYLDVDAQFGGVDQRKIFTYAMKHLPMIGYKKRIHLMNPMILGINSGKMSASDELSKIDIMDDEKMIKKKINKAFCEPGNTKSGLFHILKYIIFPILEMRNELFIVETYEDQKFLFFKDFESLEKEFSDLKIHPGDLKPSIIKAINKILSPIRDEMNKHADIIKKAYSSNK